MNYKKIDFFSLIKNNKLITNLKCWSNTNFSFGPIAHPQKELSSSANAELVYFNKIRDISLD